MEVGAMFLPDRESPGDAIVMVAPNRRPAPDEAPEDLPLRIAKLVISEVILVDGQPLDEVEPSRRHWTAEAWNHRCC
jgi:hypothetical protein